MLLPKSKVIGYDWENFADDMLFELGEMGGKFTCPSEAATEASNKELLDNAKLAKLREDFIVVQGDKFMPGATAKVWGMLRPRRRRRASHWRQQSSGRLTISQFTRHSPSAR